MKLNFDRIIFFPTKLLNVEASEICVGNGSFFR